MNVLILTVLLGTVAALTAGFLLGLFRGVGRSLLRLVLLVLCVVVAFSLRTTVTDTLMELPINNGQTLEEMLVAALPEQTQGMRDIILPMVKILGGILSFLVLFCALQFVSWILIYPILKLILRPLIGKKPRHRVMGALAGLLCGATIAFAVFVPINGLLCEAGKIASVSFSQTESSETPAQTGAVGSFQAEDIAAYTDSGISNFLTGVGEPFWQSLSTVSDRDGKKVVLSTQIDALSAAAQFAVSVSSLKDFRNEDGSLNTQTVRSFAEALTELDSLTPETKQTLNEMIASVAESMGDETPEALKNIDLERIDLQAESALLITVADCQESGSIDSVDMDSMIDNLSKSTVILPALSESNVTIQLDEEKKAEADAAIAKLEEKTGDEAVDAETLAQIKALFGSNG